jgi:hypothetical protein
MKGRAAQAYREAFGTVRRGVGLDVSAVHEILAGLDPEQKDALLTAWKRGYVGALRAAFRR